MERGSLSGNCLVIKGVRECGGELATTARLRKARQGWIVCVRECLACKIRRHCASGRP